MALFTDGPLASFDDLRDQDSQIGDVASVEGIDVTVKLVLAHEQVGMELEQLLSGLQPIEKVVETVPLKLWDTYRAIEMVYADAYYSHLNDRYKAKRDQFHDLSDYAFLILEHLGVGFVNFPVPRAEMPVLAAASGSLPPGTYYATMAWVNHDNEEGQAARGDAVQVFDGGFTVTPRNPPEAAAGWNVFGGMGPTTMVLQNSSPLAVGEIWRQAGA